MPISVLRYDVDKDLLPSGIPHLPFQLFQEIRIKDKSETVYLVVVVVLHCLATSSVEFSRGRRRERNIFILLALGGLK